MRQRQRKFAAWIAIFAVLLAALAPSVSHALAATGWKNTFSPQYASGTGGQGESSSAARLRDAQMHELCITDAANASAFKTASLASSASSPHSHDDADLHFEHCPFCFTHAGSFGLTAAQAFVLPQANGASAMPALFYRAPAPLFAWTRSQPRAPPVFS